MDGRNISIDGRDISIDGRDISIDGRETSMDGREDKVRLFGLLRVGCELVERREDVFLTNGSVDCGIRPKSHDCRGAAGMLGDDGDSVMDGRLMRL
jgi:hypothetical protein